MNIATLQAACKASPHHRVKFGALEVFGSQGANRWFFGYTVSRQADGKTRVSHGRRNAEEHLNEKGSAFGAIEELQFVGGLGQWVAVSEPKTPVKTGRATHAKRHLYISSVTDSCGIEIHRSGTADHRPERLCSLWAPGLNGRVPEPKEAQRIIDGETVELACECWNAELEFKRAIEQDDIETNQHVETAEEAARLDRGFEIAIEREQKVFYVYEDIELADPEDCADLGALVARDFDHAYEQARAIWPTQALILVISNVDGRQSNVRRYPEVAPVAVKTLDERADEVLAKHDECVVCNPQLFTSWDFYCRRLARELIQCCQDVALTDLERAVARRAFARDVVPASLALVIEMNRKAEGA